MPAAWNVAVPEAPPTTPRPDSRNEPAMAAMANSWTSVPSGASDPPNTSATTTRSPDAVVASCSVMAPLIVPAAVASVAAGLSSRAEPVRVDAQLERAGRGDDAGGGRGQRDRGVEAWRRST